MVRFFYSLIAVFILLSSVHVSANRIDDLNLKNYVYDDEGNPIFIKIYVESSNRNKGTTLPTLQQEGLQLVLNRMTQNDQRGAYIVVPIKKKHKDEDDDYDQEESTWECPYCHRTNKASSNYCETKGCVLHR